MARDTMLLEDVNDEQLRQLIISDCNMGWDKESLLGESVNNNQDGIMTRGHR